MLYVDFALKPAGGQKRFRQFHPTKPNQNLLLCIQPVSIQAAVHDNAWTMSVKLKQTSSMDNHTLRDFGCGCSKCHHLHRHIHTQDNINPICCFVKHDRSRLPRTTADCIHEQLHVSNCALERLITGEIAARKHQTRRYSCLESCHTIRTTNKQKG